MKNKFIVGLNKLNKLKTDAQVFKEYPRLSS